MESEASGIRGTAEGTANSRKIAHGIFEDFLIIKGMQLQITELNISDVNSGLIRQFGTYLNSSCYKKTGDKKLIMSGNYFKVIHDCSSIVTSIFVLFHIIFQVIWVTS